MISKPFNVSYLLMIATTIHSNMILMFKAKVRIFLKCKIFVPQDLLQAAMCHF